MSKTQKRKGLGIPLDEFKLDPSDLDLKLTRSLISVIDGYRIYRCFDLTFIGKRQQKGELPQSFIRQWTTMRAVLHKFAAVGPGVENVEEYLKQRQIIAFSALALLTISAPLLVFGWIFNIDWINAINIPLALLAVGSVLTSAVTNAWYNRKVAWAIFNYTESHPDLLKKEQEILFEWVQALVYHAARLMRLENIDPEKKITKFYNVDYKGIEVVKEPGGLRKHYDVKIHAERRKR
ncbi:hypothetical protein EU528_03935 [Candidatus Thorarchaeota archaeon]|nr:MAG: hypothetical protein EU528_03935 [Candidatus Thorarchaeota archaeon]